MIKLTKESAPIIKALEEEGFLITPEKLIVSDGDFEEDPIRIMRAVRFSAELGLDLHKETYEAVAKKRRLLAGVSPDMIRQEFERIIVADHAGSGLKMLARTGLMSYIIGGLAERMTKRAASDFADLVENIDKTEQITDRRLGLFYTCFEKKDAYEAAKILNYDKKTLLKIKDALELLEPMHFIATKLEFKKFVAQYGMARYEYLNGLSKAISVVHDTPNAKILTRYYIMEEIKAKGEPLFLKDLVIDKDDLTSRGIAEGRRADEILEILFEMVQRRPQCNQRDHLLSCAREYSKNKIVAAVQRMRWLK